MNPQQQAIQPGTIIERLTGKRWPRVLSMDERRGIWAMRYHALPIEVRLGLNRVPHTRSTAGEGK